MKCRLCGSVANQIFVDLGHQPPSNAYLAVDQLALPEVTFPLRVYVCNSCWLVQLPVHVESQKLFTETYAYFSSVSTSWVDHAKRYVAAMADRLDLSCKSFVVEVASNDGYLLQFVRDRGIPCLGIEPTRSTALAAREKGIETVEEFFGRDFAAQLVRDYGSVDLLIGNNVLAHVPDLNDFVAGVAIALAKDGIATFEFPHLMQLVRGCQFDTIYHEHYSYLSFHVVMQLFHAHGLQIFDVEELPTHGGSLRVFAARASSRMHSQSCRVDEMLAVESAAGLQTREYYTAFQQVAETVKNNLLTFLLERRNAGESICGYGAAAKGNTLLNYAGVKPDLLSFVCDGAPSKQGKFLPGSHIPVVSPETLKLLQPDYVLILPWNIAAEICAQHEYISTWGGQFVRGTPVLGIVNK